MTRAFSQSDIRAIISAPYLFGVVTFVLFAVATPNKYGDLLFESRMTSRRLRECGHALSSPACLLWWEALAHWPLGEFNKILTKIIFRLILVTDGYDISSKIALRWTALDLSDNKSPLVQVMAWCRQATSHYLSQCWPRSLSPYGITRPQWVNWSELLHYRISSF